MLFAINTFKIRFVKKQPIKQNKNPDKSFFKQTSSKQVDHLYSGKKMVGVFIELEVLLGSTVVEKHQHEVKHTSTLV